MAAPHILILNSGGLRSLVATAMVRQEGQRQRVTLLHAVDGRANAAVRLDYAHHQAERYQINRVIELDLPHLFSHGHGQHADGRPLGAMTGAQLLVTALAHARLIQADRVIWPASFNGDARPMALATEEAMLCQHLAQLEGDPAPALETPLLELSDQQVIELGGQLDVPWQLGWSCHMGGETICRACTACRRRRRAFEEAGMVDPIEKLTATP